MGKAQRTHADCNRGKIGRLASVSVQHCVFRFFSLIVDLYAWARFALPIRTLITASFNAYIIVRMEINAVYHLPFTARSRKTS